MRKAATLFMAALLVALPAMAKQEVSGRISDTPRILFLGTEIADNDIFFCRVSFEPFIRVLNAPSAGSTVPLKLQITDLPPGTEMYLYVALMMGRDVPVFGGIKIRNGSIISIPAPATGWQPGLWPIKVVVATGRLWEVKNDTLYYIYPYSCCPRVEVEQIHVIIETPPAFYPPPPSKPTCQNCYSCWPCKITGIIGAFLLLNAIICGCP